jgi:F1F0 ATPase subunit 2
MTNAALASALAIASAMVAAGFVLGRGYFVLLRWTVTLYGSGSGHLAPTLTLGRIAVAVAFFIFAARVGVLPLLAAFLGFLAARACALRTMRRTG